MDFWRALPLLRVTLVVYQPRPKGDLGYQSPLTYRRTCLLGGETDSRLRPAASLEKRRAV